MNDYTARVYLAFHGDFNPFEFAKCVRLMPAECVDMHSRNPERQLPRTTLLHYADTHTSTRLIDLYQLADQAIGILEPHLDEFVAAVARFKTDVVFQVILYFPASGEVSTPIAGFSARVVHFLSALGGSIDIDSYLAD